MHRKGDFEAPAGMKISIVEMACVEGPSKTGMLHGQGSALQEM
jgi:hypothetical protein